uniref:Focal adhesion kinase 1 n=1 Tax=Schistocephalus solidus TaxID=70667 RepID=A0A0V0J5K1_SCHSO
MSELDIATISTQLGYVKIKCSPELTVEELTRLAVQKISLTSSSSRYGLEITENASNIVGRRFLCPHLTWSEVCETVRNNTVLLSVRFFPTKFEDSVRRDRSALFYLYDQVIQQYKNVWEENRDFQMCFEIGCLMLKMFIGDKITESSLEAVEKSQDLSAFFPQFVLQHQKEKYLKRAILNHAPTLQYHSKEECILEILNRLLLLIQFDNDAYTCFLGAGLGIPVRVLLGPRSQVRISIGNTKEIRLLTFFMSIEKVVVSEISSREGRRYQVKLILANDPEAGQPIIFTFDSRTVADTVAHTVEGYCRLARPEAKQPDRPLLIWGCPFRPLRNCPFSESGTAGKMTADGEPTLVRSQITLERVLGEGQFGDVYKGAYRPAGPNSSVLPVAVKACKVGLSADDKKRCLEEADLHGKLCHPHIIKLYGACKDEPVWLVLEFAGEGELRHHLIERQDRIPLAILVTYCHQLASALAYIEAMRIIHRDVAARNVLVANETCVKLADFGMARQLGELDYYVAEPGRKVPIKWMAPESLQSRIFSSASDVWMFGVCMWEILSFGLKPFSNLTNAEAVEHVANGERLSRPAICIPILYRLMLECWLKDPVLRPTFASLQPKLREILSEVKRISLEKAAGLSAPSTESTSDRYKEPGVTCLILSLFIPQLKSTVKSRDNIFRGF